MGLIGQVQARENYNIKWKGQSGFGEMGNDIQIMTKGNSAPYGSIL